MKARPLTLCLLVLLVISLISSTSAQHTWVVKFETKQYWQNIDEGKTEPVKTNETAIVKIWYETDAPKNISQMAGWINKTFPKPRDRVYNITLEFLNVTWTPVRLHHYPGYRSSFEHGFGMPFIVFINKTFDYGLFELYMAWGLGNEKVDCIDLAKNPTCPPIKKAEIGRKNQTVEPPGPTVVEIIWDPPEKGPGNQYSSNDVAVRHDAFEGMWRIHFHLEIYNWIWKFDHVEEEEVTYTYNGTEYHATKKTEIWAKWTWTEWLDAWTPWVPWFLDVYLDISVSEQIPGLKHETKCVKREREIMVIGNVRIGDVEVNITFIPSEYPDEENCTIPKLYWEQYQVLWDVRGAYTFGLSAGGSRGGGFPNVKKVSSPLPVYLLFNVTEWVKGKRYLSRTYLIAYAQSYRKFLQVTPLGSMIRVPEIYGDALVIILLILILLTGILHLLHFPFPGAFIGVWRRLIDSILIGTTLLVMAYMDIVARFINRYFPIGQYLPGANDVLTLLAQAPTKIYQQIALWVQKVIVEYSIITIIFIMARLLEKAAKALAIVVPEFYAIVKAIEIATRIIRTAMLMFFPPFFHSVPSAFLGVALIEAVVTVTTVLMVVGAFLAFFPPLRRMGILVFSYGVAGRLFSILALFVMAYMVNAMAIPGTFTFQPTASTAPTTAVPGGENPYSLFSNPFDLIGPVMGTLWHWVIQLPILDIVSYTIALNVIAYAGYAALVGTGLFAHYVGGKIAEMLGY